MARGQDYVKTKALEAVEAADGNRHEAALLLRVWADADDKLYRALTAPLMANLTALAVQRATGASDGRRIGGSGAKKKGGKGGKQQIAEADLLAAIGSRTGQTMSSYRQSAAPPAQGSARHKQAVTLLASAYRRKPSS
ncbi:MAG: hypothetical protein NXI18_04235 [Alphaproteobacteria bacterium]|nr:hypothetical protein [Alphaproteobacteria bacterium]